jgi:hypothetical protein
VRGAGFDCTEAVVQVVKLVPGNDGPLMGFASLLVIVGELRLLPGDSGSPVGVARGVAAAGVSWTAAG